MVKYDQVVFVIYVMKIHILQPLEGQKLNKKVPELW